MRICLILAGLLLSLAAASQDIYRWVDRNGVVHYADQPGAPDAVQVTIDVPNSYETPPVDDSGPQPILTPPLPRYDSLMILQPTREQVFYGANVKVTVTADLAGEMQPGHSLVFYVDGNQRPATLGRRLELEKLERGAHSVRASVIDSEGAPVIMSEEITFHLRQPSINSPQSPQARRPAPPPAPRPAN